MIQEYSFGKIKISGNVFNWDVEVWNSGEVWRWFRGESHVIDVGAIGPALERRPDIMVVGTGHSGMAWITPEVEAKLQEKSVLLVEGRTSEAVRMFNVLLKNEPTLRIVGLFHLTC